MGIPWLQKVPGRFNDSVGAELNLTGEGVAVPSGTKVELPYWLAESLVEFYQRDETLFDMETPRIYNNRVRNAIIAGPTSVDTRRIHPYFHRLGIKFVQKFEQEQLAQVLKLASIYTQFSMRCDMFANMSPLTLLISRGNWTRQNDNVCTVALFRLAHDSAMAMKSWQSGSKPLLQSAVSY
ncbi:hypothetical protein INT44_008035 [Umbelopsis vinacea]|uniref:DNA replication complex GINS protein PSF3 n=1 Tax=Umbelopsis vinacea TaxID=44442 RepID=A0A8H7PNK2_9FUNG|nr:hypothetical protein INT44_008035 [Umbelopsis vinacea]